jgi:hypothetical protein
LAAVVIYTSPEEKSHPKFVREMWGRRWRFQVS